MKRFLLRHRPIAALAAIALIAGVGFALAGDCNVSNCKEQGGSRWHIGGSLDIQSGGDLDIESGAAFKIAGSDLAAELAILDGVTASTADLNATTNFEETISATTSEVTIATGKTLDIADDGALQLNNAAVTSTAAELNILDGASLTVTELDEYAITVEIEDICAAASAWVVAPHAGDVTKIYTVIDSAIITADAVLDPQIATVSITNGGITITQSGSAAGDVDSSTPTAANTVTAGQAIEIASDGGCGDAAGVVKTTATILIAR